MTLCKKFIRLGYLWAAFGIPDVMAGLAGAPEGSPPSFDQQLQAPVLETSNRGSLAGELASFAQDGTDLMKGRFSFTLPFYFPEERGRLLFPIVPKYSITNGISEWGIGFDSTLSITRFRRQGFVQYQGDEFVSPWGTLIQGSDGFYYPEGLQTPIKLERTDSDQWKAYLPNGDQLTFGDENTRISTSKGTFSWYLSKAESVTGEKTHYIYHQSETVNQKPLLSRVLYGGKGEQFQYQIDFRSVPVSKPFFDYHSGERMTLSRRIDKVSLSINQGGTFSERFSYFLNYRESAYGPGYYLKSFIKRYQSGSEEPPFILDYNFPEDLSKRKKWHAVDSFTPILKSFPNALVPERYSSLSLEEDGLAQIELTNIYRRITLKENEYQVSEPPAKDGLAIDPYCRRDEKDYLQIPRLHSRLRGKGKPLEVLGFEVRNTGQRPYKTTLIHVCDLEGRLTQLVSIPGYDLKPGLFSKLVDLSQNGKPDLVTIAPGAATTEDNPVRSEIRLKIFKNTSTDELIHFDEPIEVALYGYFSSDSSYLSFQDINGDGILDLILIKSNAIYVWYGKGNYDFEKNSHNIPFKLFDSSNSLFAENLHEARIHFQDLNGDGLPEAIVQRDSGSTIFINKGTEFLRESKGVLESRSWGRLPAPPHVLDILGTGNVQLVSRDIAKQQVNVIELTEPGTGLLNRIDDGKGNHIDFTYRRLGPMPGIGTRFPVVDKIRISVSGEGSKLEEYQFEQPHFHSQDRGFLGFSEILKTTPLGESFSYFQYGDQQPGILIRREEHDFRSLDLWRFLTQTYETSKEMGLEWSRLKSIEKGFRQNSNLSAQTTRFEAYEKGVCPTQISKRGSHGTSTLDIHYFSSSELSNSLHCLLESMRTQGAHPNNPTFDFNEGIQVQRNDQGLPTQVTRLGAKDSGLSKILQTIEYTLSDSTPSFKIHKITVPGSGTTTFGYDPNTTLLSSIVPPGGVTLQAARDPVQDQIRELKEDYGDGKVFIQHSDYDGFERLKKSWNQLSLDSMLHQETEFEYDYASSFAPGWIQVSKKSGAGQSSAPIRELSIQSGSGLELATLVDLGTGSVLKDLKSKDSAQLTSQGYALQIGVGPDFFHRFTQQPSYAELYGNASSIRTDSRHLFGLELSENQTHQTGVFGKMESTYSVHADSVFQSKNENDAILWTHATDSEGQPTLTRIPETPGTPGTEYRFERDNLGRVVRIVLPSGEDHRAKYNDLGELAEISRTGVGSIRFFYPAQAQWIERKDYLDEAGNPVRSVHWTYDPQGRKTSVLYRDAHSGQEEVHRYYYDGVLPGKETIPGQKGRLSAIDGPSYRKSWIYREDGKITHEDLTIEGFTTLATDFQYDLNGSVLTKSLGRKNPQGVWTLNLPFRYEKDSFERESKTYLNDSLLYQISYNAYSQIAKIEAFDRPSDPNSQFHFSLDYDSTTQQETGLNQKIGSSTHYESSWTKGPRGLIDTEKFSLGQKTTLQSHLYNPSGFLIESSGDRGKTEYRYDDRQMVNEFKSESQNLSILSDRKNRWKTHNGSYTLDPVGRVTKKKAFGQNALFTYGPQGRVSQVVQFPQTAVEYGYDQEGKRLFKKRGGRIEEVYAADLVLTPELTLTPLRAQGKLLGYLENDSLKPLLMDLRGSVVSEDEMTLNLPEAYGERIEGAHTSSRSRLIAYAQVGYDPDLKSYRMEQRDYDPVIKRFLTPDPLFLEHPEKCLESPVECSLYGYAKNNPVNFVDPTGLMGAAPHVIGTTISLGIWAYHEVNSSHVTGDAIHPTSSPVDFFAGSAGARLGSGLAGGQGVSDSLSADMGARNFRYMTSGEVNAVHETGYLRGGREGVTCWTNQEMKSASTVQERLALPNSPTHRMEFDILNSPATQQGRVAPNFNQPGKGFEIFTKDPVKVDVINVQQLKN